MANANFITEHAFDRLTKILIGLAPNELTKAVQSRIDQDAPDISKISPIEAHAIYLAYWALNADPESAYTEGKIPEAWSKLLSLLERAETNREFAFVRWADCCLESLH